MANRQKVRMHRLEKKYSKIIEKVLKEYKDKDKTMGELWEALDKIKAEMKEEMDAI